jgi:hypothetical protein
MIKPLVSLITTVGLVAGMTVSTAARASAPVEGDGALEIGYTGCHLDAYPVFTQYVWGHPVTVYHSPRCNARYGMFDLNGYVDQSWRPAQTISVALVGGGFQQSRSYYYRIPRNYFTGLALFQGHNPWGACGVIRFSPTSSASNCTYIGNL